MAPLTTTATSGRSSHFWSGTPITAASSDRGMGHHLVLQLDRGDPLATGLDHVLGPVGQPQVAVRADRADVTGPQPAAAELLLVVDAVVGTGHPRPATSSSPTLSVVRRAVPSSSSSQPPLTATGHRPWVNRRAQAVRRRPCPVAADGAQWRGLRHAPGVQDCTSCLSWKLRISDGGHARPADDHVVQRSHIRGSPRGSRAALPDRRHRAGQGRAARRAMIFAIGSGCRNRSGMITRRRSAWPRRASPGHRVEHRHDQPCTRSAWTRPSSRPCTPASSAARSTGASTRRPWGCRWCREV